MAEPPTKRPCHNFLQRITVCVGEEDDEQKQEFKVHKSFATKSSKFLRAALEGEWKEAREKCVAVKTGVGESQAYLEWLYTNEVTLQEEDGEEDLGPVLIRLYLPGDYLDDANFCNAVMDTVFQRGKTCEFTDQFINSALENMVAGSPLRALVLQFMAIATISNLETITSYRHRFSSDTMLDLIAHVMSDHDLAKALQTALRQKGDLSGKDCDFHRHDEGTPKCSEPHV